MLLCAASLAHSRPDRVTAESDHYRMESSGSPAEAREHALRKEIEELVSTGKSIMPEGLEKQIPKQDMADLIEYLMRVQ